MGCQWHTHQQVLRLPSSWRLHHSSKMTLGSAIGCFANHMPGVVSFPYLLVHHKLEAHALADQTCHNDWWTRIQSTRTLRSTELVSLSCHVQSHAGCRWVSLIGAAMSALYSIITFGASLAVYLSNPVAPSYAPKSGDSRADEVFGILNAIGGLVFAYGGQVVLLEIQVSFGVRAPWPGRSQYSCCCCCCCCYGLLSPWLALVIGGPWPAELSQGRLVSPRGLKGTPALADCWRLLDCPSLASVERGPSCPISQSGASP